MGQKKQGGNSGGGGQQQQKKKKTDKKMGKKKQRIARYFDSVEPTRKLRRVLRSNGPKFAAAWASKRQAESELGRLAKEQTKVGRLARQAMRPTKKA